MVTLSHAPEVSLAFRAERSLDQWNIDHEAGRAPDAYPYGLHKIAPRFSIGWNSLPEAGVADQLRHTVFPPQSRRDASWALAWDEYLYMRTVTALPGRRYATGVIWATDELNRGFKARARARMLLRTVGGAEVVWVLSRAQLPILREIWGTKGPRLEFVQFGVADDYFVPAPQPTEPSVLSLGNDRDRDHPTLLAALSYVHSQRPDVRLRVQLKGDVVLPPGIERVPFMSFPELRREYHASSVVAIATRSNLHVSGMTTALEAMASSRAVVMTKSPGLDDYIRDGETGLVVPPKDPRALADSILLALDGNSAAQLGAAGRAAVERTHNTTSMADRISQVLSV